MKCYYYADSISNFQNTSDKLILADLDKGSREFQSLLSSQAKAWDREIEDLHSMFSNFAIKGSIIFEYSLYRLGRRIDVVLLINGIVFILEYKTFGETFRSADAIQVFDYALDLKNFHKESKHRHIVPILIITEINKRKIELEEYRDQVYAPIICNTNTLQTAIEYCLKTIRPGKYSSDADWIESKYEPTPTIIDAVTHMYRSHTVKDIVTRGSGDSDFFKTCEAVTNVIKDSCEQHRKSICFVTGVPGAGKTLVGLEIAVQHLEAAYHAVYFSGNKPLVDVLRESLARDMVAQSKKEREQKINEIKRSALCEKEKKDAIKLIPKAQTKKDAYSKVQALIQMVHNFVRACLVNTIEHDGKIVEDVKNKRSSKSSFIPGDHVAIFDEAQRAWTKRGLATFLKEKYNWKNFPFSEPEFLISCLDRRSDWGVVICLVGGGQEINHDEAGIGEWIESLNRSYPDWHVYISDKLTDSEYMAGNALSELQAHHNNLHISPEFHLAVSRRSLKTERLAAFVKSLLDIDIETAKQELKNLNDYPILITRDLDVAKEQLRKWAKGSSDRYGLLVSSKASRLKPLAIDVRVKPSVTAYFLNGPDDIRSSLFLEDAVSEFDVQGLELDWTCLVWDADFQYIDGQWSYHKIGSKKDDDDESIQCWKNINDPTLRLYQKNAYRVLLTRARQGMVLCIPKGDSKDSTRHPKLYDSTYHYLKDIIGIKEIPEVI